MRHDCVISPGLPTAIRLWLKAEGRSQASLARLAHLPQGTVNRVCNGAPCTADKFDALLAVVPCLWTRDHCLLSERPGGAIEPGKKAPKQRAFDKNVWRPIRTPALEAFNGVVGGWC